MNTAPKMSLEQYRHLASLLEAARDALLDVLKVSIDMFGRGAPLTRQIEALAWDHLPAVEAALAVEQFEAFPEAGQPVRSIKASELMLKRFDDED